jgi:hypothetical protein
MAGQGLLVETGPANPGCVETSDTSATSPPDAVPTGSMSLTAGSMAVIDPCGMSGQWGGWQLGIRHSDAPAPGGRDWRMPSWRDADGGNHIDRSRLQESFPALRKAKPE